MGPGSNELPPAKVTAGAGLGAGEVRGETWANEADKLGMGAGAAAGAGAGAGAGAEPEGGL